MSSSQVNELYLHRTSSYQNTRPEISEGYSCQTLQYPESQLYYPEVHPCDIGAIFLCWSSYPEAFLSTLSYKKGFTSLQYYATNASIFRNDILTEVGYFACHNIIVLCTPRYDLTFMTTRIWWFDGLTKLQRRGIDDSVLKWAFKTWLLPYSCNLHNVWHAALNDFLQLGSVTLDALSILFVHSYIVNIGIASFV